MTTATITAKLKVVCTGFENQGICAMCGDKLDKQRQAYCSDECANQYCNLFYLNSIVITHPPQR